MTYSQDQSDYETDTDWDNDEAREMLISSGLLPASHFYGDGWDDDDEQWIGYED